MKEFINSLTGTRMFVADEREEEYKKAGHRPADIPEPEPPAPDAGSAPEASETDTGAARAAEEEKPETEPAAPAPAGSMAARARKRRFFLLCVEKLQEFHYVFIVKCRTIWYNM